MFYTNTRTCFLFESIRWKKPDSMRWTHAALRKVPTSADLRCAGEIHIIKAVLIWHFCPNAILLTQPLHVTVDNRMSCNLPLPLGLF